ncbi:pilus assembly PilX family protein [Ramlibacter humi]|uniref:Pilus assembly protein PilX n=1 Tax=Ramlibacter humi TaxID=2530451 RepID=A0A4Z0CAQ6_9BURK|nr:pilus assembly protein PilX [Ramlibacter humi]TFZ08726.1 pilus assembly protein PilX [Ramlibacter humi]
MNRLHRSPLRRLQRGVSLLFALMAMVVLGFAAVALTRSVDTGALIMGNLSFKQDTLQASNTGAEQAITWLQANVNNALLNADSAPNGYYAAMPARLDATGNRTSSTDKWTLINWDGDCLGVPAANRTDCSMVPASGTNVNGNQVQYVIVRLCTLPGTSATGNVCLRPSSTSSSSSSERGELKPGGKIVSATTTPYYQVLVRVLGPRNTVSYTETMVHF